ncbi:type III toxin-antitoxin system ToxN/AbiQ family toxin [Vibrio parahaemolyticus]|uniref:type III toxin-antitoxin system ToxN/AbiQ family toxin n=1 Tax=Vibrio parahaemolyticus TaxID=670 RepID=UPI0015DE03AE|nr:type III toxin-antitoxin system ToxN/AbiQ family toxin [Vibrio parahaemolyticus]ELI3524288.1 type III toxin-antitoxin system ToxN/AbiQ family toxin [Vibrio vulnificus]EJG1355478.1 type III toxin-antitoxin system ToxN/AbiQ family toxin [Vibrio parahaemolyticus]EJG1611347.1 type III toxin-antitoxin system ToxN/AbiQ family toxin [Vibrio parahaemolyticus]MCC3831431.1 type III toxin-antitoxin system ToxN/AbiQ family toxin [Vibrio parahaemolyticus]MDF4825096.1 type III toxin-antitoxin system ToxN
MRFYTVSDDYVEYLRTIDHKVPHNKGDDGQKKRPYVGIILDVGGHKFLAPLTSYKKEQDKIPASRCTAFKLHERTNSKNKLGMINLAYMIPILDKHVSELNIDAQTEDYKNLLHLQYEFIKVNKDEIRQRATKLLEHILVKRTAFYVKISCSFSALVDSYRLFDE